MKITQNRAKTRGNRIFVFIRRGNCTKNASQTSVSVSGATSCHLEAILGPSWGHPGAILGPAWAILGHPGAILRPTWGNIAVIVGHFESSCKHLGTSWGHLGPCWAILGPPRASLECETAKISSITKQCYCIAYAMLRRCQCKAKVSLTLRDTTATLQQR